MTVSCPAAPAPAHRNSVQIRAHATRPATDACCRCRRAQVAGVQCGAAVAVAVRARVSDCRPAALSCSTASMKAWKRMNVACSSSSNWSASSLRRHCAATNENKNNKQTNKKINTLTTMAKREKATHAPAAAASIARYVVTGRTRAVKRRGTTLCGGCCGCCGCGGCCGAVAAAATVRQTATATTLPVCPVRPSRAHHVRIRRRHLRFMHGLQVAWPGRMLQRRSTALVVRGRGRRRAAAAVAEAGRDGCAVIDSGTVANGGGGGSSNHSNRTGGDAVEGRWRRRRCRCAVQGKMIDGGRSMEAVAVATASDAVAAAAAATVAALGMMHRESERRGRRAPQPAHAA